MVGGIFLNNLQVGLFQNEVFSGYDCGIYVIKIAEEVCQSKLQARDWSATSLTSGEITNYRIKIKNLISELASKS